MIPGPDASQPLLDLDLGFFCLGEPLGKVLEGSGLAPPPGPGLEPPLGDFLALEPLLEAGGLGPDLGELVLQFLDSCEVGVCKLSCYILEPLLEKPSILVVGPRVLGGCLDGAGRRLEAATTVFLEGPPQVFRRSLIPKADSCSSDCITVAIAVLTVVVDGTMDVTNSFNDLSHNRSERRAVSRVGPRTDSLI